RPAAAEAEGAPPESPRPVLVASAPAAPSPEDNIGPLQSLPESVQREIPRVSFGGYIYSPNPAERLLLVDKMLRREGEEVAPGLVLERLLPKAAIMNYRGTRYRVAY
ncbi:general secretion pathway protein GspB, partial [Massilia sp.]|uniref:general secretion pathway protein GspB n=1 Tax=Massilia sp. TaxID=1882437 RepID=UPI003919C29C